MVDFPLPFEPTRTTNWPDLMENVTSSKAFVSDLLPGYEKETFLKGYDEHSNERCSDLVPKINGHPGLLTLDRFRIFKASVFDNIRNVSNSVNSLHKVH